MNFNTSKMVYWLLALTSIFCTFFFFSLGKNLFYWLLFLGIYFYRLFFNYFKFVLSTQHYCRKRSFRAETKVLVIACSI